MGGLLFGLLPMLLGRKMGCGTILLLGVLAFVFLGPGSQMLSTGGGTADPMSDSRGTQQGVACDTAAERFACQVFSSTNRFWESQINGYRAPGLRFYTDHNSSGCGAAQAAMGPFYCPADQGIYLDTSFFNELKTKFGAAGDAAQAYVVAHEVGHHIQTITGTSDQVRRAQARASQTEGNAIQVRMELQADCYAGVWAARARTKDGADGDGAGRHGGGDDRRQRDRRRYADALGGPATGARKLHPRHQRAAHALAPPRAGDRRSAPVRHVRRQRDLIAVPSPCSPGADCPYRAA